MRSFLRRALGFAVGSATAITFLSGLSSCGGKVIVDGVDPTGAGTTGDGATGGDTTGATTTGSGTTSSSSGGSDDGWTTLVEGTWSLPVGTETYWCSLKTITEDTYVKAFRAKAPEGTHHTLLLWAGGGQPDGEAACGPTLSSSMLHASGVGSDDLVFPDGVALKIPAGSQILLNLHLFNASAGPLSGTSATLVKTVPASEVKEEAEFVLPGTATINVPPHGSSTSTATCSFPAASTISTVWPHMHMFGTHMKVTYEGGQGTKILHDGPYSFGEQKNYPIDPLTVGPGDTINIECSYQNTTDQTITWGDSSKAEMCFAGLYRYPKVAGLKCK